VPRPFGRSHIPPDGHHCGPSGKVSFGALRCVRRAKTLALVPRFRTSEGDVMRSGCLERRPRRHSSQLLPLGSWITTSSETASMPRCPSNSIWSAALAVPAPIPSRCLRRRQCMPEVVKAQTHFLSFPDDAGSGMRSNGATCWNRSSFG
jgi:hypothetical protein